MFKIKIFHFGRLTLRKSPTIIKLRGEDLPRIFFYLIIGNPENHCPSPDARILLGRDSDADDSLRF